MTRKILRELLLFALFLAMAIVLTWPLAIRLSTTVSDMGDPLLNAWIVNWDQYAWTHGHAVYQAPIFYPAKYPLAFSENLFGIATLMMPFYLAGLGPMTVYNLAFLLGLAFCGYGASVLARVVSRSMTAGIICGTLFAFCQYRFDHLPHLQIVWSGWLPLILAALLVYWRDPRLRTAVFFGAALLMNGLTNIHWLLFGTTAAGIAALVLALLAGRRPLRFWIQLGAATAIALALLVPVLLPYKTVSKLYGMHRATGEVQEGSATWMDWLWSSDRNATWGKFPDWSKTKPERLLFPGMLPLLLTGAALVLYRRRDGDPPSIAIAAPPRGHQWLLPVLDVAIVVSLLVAYLGAITAHYELRLGSVRLFSIGSADVPFLIALVLVVARFSFAYPRSWRGARSLRVTAAEARLPLEFWIAVVWIAIGVVGSFGLNAFFHTALYHRVQAFQSLRVPARWAMIAYVGLIATGSLGVAALLRDRRGGVRATLIAGLAIATYLDVRTRIVWEHDVAVEPVYHWLAQAKPPGPLIELPMNDATLEYIYSGRDAIHHAQTFNGASGFYPPLYIHLESLTEKKPIPDELVTTLETNGCRFLIVHDDWLRDTAAATHDWLRRELARGRLGFLRRFDHDISGDWLFAVTRNVPDWPTLHDMAHDAAGRTPDEELTAMLGGQPTYSASIIAHVDAPAYGAEVHVPFPVAGWALAAEGIKSVDILFESGRVRVHADLVDRGDVKALYPWFPRVPRPGFQKVFDKRPKGVRSDTDMSIEVTDGAGRKLQLPDVMIHWR
jgi:hypothetical protein